MAEQKYKYAPISEVICGINFSEAIFKTCDIFNIYSLLKDDYKIVNIVPPLPDEIIEDEQITGELKISNSGQARFRFRTEDNQWLVQIQLNKIYLNWVRSDDKSVGKYPGYSSIFEKFSRSINDINSKICSVEFNKLKYCELTYHDRIEWREYIDNFGELEKIINLKLPPSIINPNKKNVMSFGLERPLNDDTGLSTLIIKSLSTKEKNDILQFENVIKIFVEKQEYAEYFEKVHDMQIEAFENFFTDEVKKKWH